MRVKGYSDYKDSEMLGGFARTITRLGLMEWMYAYVHPYESYVVVYMKDGQYKFTARLGY